MSVFVNASYLSNIRESTSEVVISGIGGKLTTTQIGEAVCFGTVWYSPDSIANILSLAAVRKICRVTMDSSVEPTLCVHHGNGLITRFTEFTNGLYYHDPGASLSPLAPSTYDPVSFYGEPPLITSHCDLSQTVADPYSVISCGSPCFPDAYTTSPVASPCIPDAYTSPSVASLSIPDAYSSSPVASPLFSKWLELFSSPFLPTLWPLTTTAKHQRSLTLCLSVLFLQTLIITSRALRFHAVASLGELSTLPHLRPTEHEVRPVERGADSFDVVKRSYDEAAVSHSNASESVYNGTMDGVFTATENAGATAGATAGANAEANTGANTGANAGANAGANTGANAGAYTVY